MDFLRTYLRVLRQLGPEWRLALVLVVANLGLATAQFAEPVLFGRIIDLLTGAQAAGRTPTWGDLMPLLAAWGGFAVFSIAGSVLVALNADRLAHRRRLALMSNFFEHVLHLPLSFHTSAHSGRLLKTMLDGAAGMFSVWLAFLRENCASFAALFILLPASLFLNWRLAGLLIVLVVLFGLLTAFVLRRTEALQRQVERYNADLAEHASDALGNVPVIQSFTRIAAETGTLSDITRTLLGAQMPVLTWWALVSVATRTSGTLTLLAIFIYGTWLHLQGLASIGEIVTFMNFATMLIGRLDQVVGFSNFVFMLIPKLKDYFDVLDTEPQVRDLPGAVAAGRLEGRVTIDGRDIRDMTLDSLRSNIGVVFQEPMLFARTIEDNLRIGKPDATPVEIALALERAQAADFVARQPDGLATVIGERGRSLSGGERQRLSIARALLKDPPIMILDEATSALDATTERQLQSALAAATAGRTTFVIAHRLSTIRNADRIFVFDSGRVVEQGSFDALVARGGRFAALARAQFMADAVPENESEAAER